MIPGGPSPRLELGGGADHPGRPHAAQLRFADLVAARQRRSGQRDRHGLPRRHVGGAADDRALAVAGVDRADAQPVGIGVRLGAQHLADDEALGRGRPDRTDPLDLGAGHRQPLGQLTRLDARIAVLAQPGVRDPHENCSRTRTSLSKKRRRSGTPWRSIAIRSTPMPKAKPCTRSGS